MIDDNRVVAVGRIILLDMRFAGVFEVNACISNNVKGMGATLGRAFGPRIAVAFGLRPPSSPGWDGVAPLALRSSAVRPTSQNRDVGHPAPGKSRSPSRMTKARTTRKTRKARTKARTKTKSKNEKQIPRCARNDKNKLRSF